MACNSLTESLVNQCSPRYTADYFPVGPLLLHLNEKSYRKFFVRTLDPRDSVFCLLVNMIFPVVWRRRSVSYSPSEQNVAFALVHHTPGFLVVVERHGRGHDRLNVDGHLRLPAKGIRLYLC